MQSTENLPRRSGVKLDSARIDYELGRRGVTARRLAEASGVPEVTLSRARHGRPVTEGTLRRLTEGLLGIPLLIGADLLIADPDKNSRQGLHTQAAATEGQKRASAPAAS